MTARLQILAVSDPRGDLNVIARAMALADHKDVKAQGIFFLGDICGPLTTPAEHLMLDSARRTLQQELKFNGDRYREKGVTTLWGLVAEITRNPEKYRRGAEVSAANTFASMLGMKGDKGKFLEFGAAGKRAEIFYGQLAKLFAKSKVPVYMMADTVLAEEWIPEPNWMHFAWVSLGGFAIRCLGASEIDGPDTIPEYFLGSYRGGRLIRLDKYPLGSADLVFAYVLNPLLHELLSTSRGKVIIMCGDGAVDHGYPNNVVATQRPGSAYVYTLDGMKVIRRTWDNVHGQYASGLTEDLADEPSTRSVKSTRRREAETQIKLAGIGQDLKVFVDLLRAENPQLADQIEQAQNRAEAILRYVHFLEAQRVALRGELAAERAGLERIMGKLIPFFTPEQAERLTVSMRARPEAAAGVEARDKANEELATLLEVVVTERFGAASGGAVAALSEGDEEDGQPT